jgi:NAD(P)-dependent dehydrogenase (short-subunit alcohol dehydrogenase family)
MTDISYRGHRFPPIVIQRAVWLYLRFTLTSGSGPEIRGTLCDVAEPASGDPAAEATFSAFGNVHILCNNAGVGARGGVDHIALDNWRWVLDVNLIGVVNGVRAFLPHMRAHGEGGHIVNTASIAGIINQFHGFNPYPATKFAVVGMSEGLAVEAKPFGIGVSTCVRDSLGPTSWRAPDRFLYTGRSTGWARLRI